MNTLWLIFIYNAGRLNTLKILIEHGANVHAKTDGKEAEPIYYAALNGNFLKSHTQTTIVNEAITDF